MSMLIFVNKPLSALLGFLGLCLVCLVVYIDYWHVLPLFWAIAAYSFFFFTFTNYYYLLRGDKKFEIRGVDLRDLKGPFRIYVIVSVIALMTTILLSPHVFPGIIPLAVFNGLSAVILKLVLYSRFVSLALKKNPSFKDLKVEDFYIDIREVLLKKVID